MNLPNKITMTRIAMIPLVMIFISPIYDFMPDGYNRFMEGPGAIIGVILFLIAAITDFVDGHIARKNNLVTKLGKFLDPIADKLLVIAVLVILVERNQLTHWIAMIIIAREIIIMGIRIVAAGEGKVIAASKIAKIKTILQISAITAYLLDNVVNMWILADIIMGVAVVITVISGVDYYRKNKHIILEQNEK